MEYRILHDGSPTTTIYLGIGEHDRDIEGIVNALGDGDFRLVTLMSSDWNGDYSPWAAPPVFGKDGFAGNGRDTLRWLVDECMLSVGNNTRETFEVLKRQCNTTLEWNVGGHFNEPTKRLAKGIASLMAISFP